MYPLGSQREFGPMHEGISKTRSPRYFQFRKSVSKTTRKRKRMNVDAEDRKEFLMSELSEQVEIFLREPVPSWADSNQGYQQSLRELVADMLTDAPTCYTIAQHPGVPEWLQRLAQGLGWSQGAGGTRQLAHRMLADAGFCAEIAWLYDCDQHFPQLRWGPPVPDCIGRLAMALGPEAEGGSGR